MEAVGVTTPWGAWWPDMVFEAMCVKASMMLRNEHKRLGTSVVHPGGEGMACSGRETRATSARPRDQCNALLCRKM